MGQLEEEEGVHRDRAWARQGRRDEQVVNEDDIANSDDEESSGQSACDKSSGDDYQAGIYGAQTSDNELSSMNIRELKAALRERGLTVSTCVLHLLLPFLSLVLLTARWYL
jgi:hypothetical protein